MSRETRLCNKHHHRFVRHGSTAKPAKNRNPRPELMNTPETFWSKVNMLGPDECWEWSRGKARGGYGRVKWQRIPVMAHRVAFFLHNDYWPAVVMHSCDNPPCCNPTHLIAGTAVDNTADCINKDRFPQGSRSGMSKINENVVREMLSRKPYWGCQTAWAKEFGIDQTTVSGILARKSWKHVEIS